MQVGGQAVLEGVMMRAPGMVATAVRRANGEIVVKKERHISLAEKFPLFKLPVVRGALGLVEMMVIGMRTLNFSAEVAMQDVDSGKGNGHLLTTDPAETKAIRRKDSLKLGLTVTFSLVLGVAIFFVTPLLIATVLFNVDQQPLTFNLLAGVVRITLLLVYLLAISMLKDIKRLFQYHGAEHKAVFAFEKGEGLTVEAASRQSRFHPRCGTSFLLIVMIVSIFLFSVLDALIIGWLGQLTLTTRLLTHLPLIPLVGGFSYEVIKASAKRSETFIGKIVVAPGLWLQKITTKEPDESMLEVAILALRAALGQDDESQRISDSLALQGVSEN
ncbi:MAG: hypothetical protein HW412_1795 [Bacteroidetes bacterium]|nr:hypothetical protein [Bacteroidota bacterium]